jgi:hypothetical protein
MDNNITKKVLDTIHDAHLVPKPRWNFLLKQKIVWGVGLILTLFGGMAFSVIIHSIRTGDWDLYRYTSSGFIKIFFITLPYVWLVLIVLFGIVAYFNIRKTKTGYRYTMLYIIGGIVVISAVFGMLFDFIGVGKRFEHTCAMHVGAYQKLSCFQESLLHDPEHGIIVGDVISFSKETSILIIRDVHDIQWNVLIKDKNTTEPQNFLIGSKIKIIGKKVDQNNFISSEIRPMNCGCCTCGANTGSTCHMR